LLTAVLQKQGFSASMTMKC